MFEEMIIKRASLYTLRLIQVCRCRTSFLSLSLSLSLFSSYNFIKLHKKKEKIRYECKLREIKSRFEKIKFINCVREILDISSLFCVTEVEIKVFLIL